MAEIPLTRGLVSIVDDTDEAWARQWKWHAHGQLINGSKTFYAARAPLIAESDRPRMLLMHRELLGAPIGIEVDHINVNGLDNHRHNLRLATKTNNNANRVKRPPRGAKPSRFKGVTWYPTQRLWCVEVRKNYKRVWCKYFHDEVAAARSYDEGARLAFGEFARTNEMLGLFKESA